MPKRQTRKKIRQIKKNNKTSLVEKLEPRQMLTATSTDSLDFTISIVDSNGPTTHLADTSHSYSAPWNWKLPTGVQIQGAGEYLSWTAEQSGHTNSINENVRGVIKTIDDFYDHLTAHTVAEVSDDLVAVFYDSDTHSLYDPALEQAWIGSSDNLYSLLVLNQRFPATSTITAPAQSRGGNGNLVGAITGALYDSIQSIPFNKQFRISDKAIEGLTRIVGFPFGADRLIPPNPAVSSPPGIGLGIFNRAHGSFTSADPDLGVPVSSLSDYVPTLSQFFTFTNDNRPADSSAMPIDVLWNLQEKYANGFRNQHTPIDIFSEISGIENLSALISYPPQVSVPYDVYTHPTEPADRGSNYATYATVCGLVQGYYSVSEMNNQHAINAFFNFVDMKVQDLISIDRSVDPSGYNASINDIAVGLRALMAMSYDAAPLWTSYGVGYANAANPMVGNKDPSMSVPQIQSQTFLENFSGQEFQLLNIKLPPNMLNVVGESATSGELYPTEGWYALNPDIPVSGSNYINTLPDNDYQSQYSISTSGTTVVFPHDSTSGNTLSAAGIASETAMLSRTTVLSVGGPTLGEQHGLINDEQVLPDLFATYISLAGGIDLVTGSDFTDVIIGPGHGGSTNDTFHGRLTVSSGAGDDVVAPGRGGSIVELGSGADLVVFDTQDLFGEATFFDFNYDEGDRLIVNSDIVSIWDSSTPDTLILSDEKGATKTLRLAASSDKTWARDVIVRVRPTELLIDTPVATGGTPGSKLAPDGEFNYLETHQFVFAGTNTDFHTKSLKIEKSAGGPGLPDEIWVTAGKVPYQSKSGTGTHIIPLNKFQLGDAPWTENGVDQPVVISITPYDNAGVRGFGNRQAQVFITPDDGYVRSKYDSTTDFKVNLTIDDMTGQNGPDPRHLAQTGWRLFKEANKTTYAVAYVGGLANIILHNDLNATSTLPTALEPVQLKIDGIMSDGEFKAGVGHKAFNLSSGMAIWGGLTKQVADTVMAQTATAAQGAYVFDLPAGLSPKDYVLKTLATDQPIVVSGTGRINGFDIVSTYNNKYDARTHAPYYVNSDLLTISSVHHTNNHSGDDWAVDVSPITVAWPAYRGVGPVILQDFNNLAMVQQNSSGEFEIDVAPTDNRLKFGHSKVRMRGYRQVGGWVDQADGPAISGWYSEISNSFIHANDDSVKVQAPLIKASANTVLQGNAGNAVGYAYGFVNGSVLTSLVDQTFVHRIVNKHAGNGYGVVAMRVVPDNYWSWYNTFGKLTVENIYVPSFDKTNFGSMNSVYRANVLEIGNECRGFGPTVNAGDPSFLFQVGGINTTNGWEIRADHVLDAEASVVRWSDPATPNQPAKDANGHWTFEPTKFQLYEKLPNHTRVLTSTYATVQQNTSWGPINLYQTPKSTTETKTIKRPKLHRSSKILLNRDGVIGPSPIRLVHTDLVQAAAYGASAGEESFIVSNVANGRVEKKIGDSWFNVSEAITTSSPSELIALMSRRVISSTDEIRWVPSTEDSTKATAEAFAIFGWNKQDGLVSDRASVISFEHA